ncbi:Hsp20/alpha crystallin family protein [Flavobacterium sp. HBTb2-11-1]|uniref:Hsp20/alpha crystallin family protein n=1 Tax=Flavobacterium sp. HBTb2-11-1 TaxID=2692212 RepID=UPI00136FF1AD|nr:Hsp20/alpha crystallin family protein [Flavobacterium sp. HBTb2-11-1]MXO06708.1 Hsp20 family protein [Flavobacterium sp. HBTb2-11-1]
MTTLVPTQKKNSSQLSVFDDFFSSRFPDFSPFFSFGNQNGIFTAQANIIENSNDFEIEIAAPGFKSEDFKVEIKDGVLHASAEKEEESEEENKNFRKKEFSFSSFSRAFVLPENINSDKIDAKYKNGVLKLALPKKKSSTAKPVQHIKVN